MDNELHSIITNKSVSDAMLLEAISHLGRVSEPPQFWTRIANDSAYTITHRQRAVFALFRRHGTYCSGLKGLGELLEPAQWLDDRTVEQIKLFFGQPPVNPILDQSVFEINVLCGPSIYVGILGEMELENFVRLIRNRPVDFIKDQRDASITQFGYTDDYEQWYRPKQSPR